MQNNPNRSVIIIGEKSFWNIILGDCPGEKSGDQVIIHCENWSKIAVLGKLPPRKQFSRGQFSGGQFSRGQFSWHRQNHGLPPFFANIPFIVIEVPGQNCELLRFSIVSVLKSFYCRKVYREPPACLETCSTKLSLFRIFFEKLSFFYFGALSRFLKIKTNDPSNIILKTALGAINKRFSFFLTAWCL